MIEYRFSTARDLDQLLPMLAEFFVASRVQELGAQFDEGYVRSVLSSMMEAPDSVVLVAVDGDRCCGAIGAHLSHHVMDRSAGLVLELFQWVVPEYRGRRIGGGLLTALESWSRLKGAVTLGMMSLPALGGPVESQFQDHGFSPVEVTWMKRLGPGI